MTEAEELELLRSLVRKTFTDSDDGGWFELTEHVAQIDGGIDLTPEEYAYLAALSPTNTKDRKYTVHAIR